MNYTEYLMMFSYKTEEERLNQQVNERYKVSQSNDNERPQRHRRQRFWWHLQNDKSSEENHIANAAEQKLWIKISNYRQSK